MATTKRLVSSAFLNSLVTNPLAFRLLFTSFVTTRFASQTRLLGGDDWLFFNYGYEEDPPMALPLEASDEPHRYSWVDDHKRKLGRCSCTEVRIEFKPTTTGPQLGDDDNEGWVEI